VTTSWSDGGTPPTPLTPHVHPKDAISYRLKRVLLGHPLTRDALRHQRLSKVTALGVLSSDCISSSAYGSEQILIALIPAFGIAAFATLMPMTFVIIGVLIVVTFSYRQVVSVYTKTGGSYVVARDNFGPVVAQVAAVALMLDYVVTVAVQAAAGTAALVSAFSALAPFTTAITVGVVLVLFYGNLRGVREAGKAFAFPTYFFIISMLAVFVMGIYREMTGRLTQYPLHTAGMVSVGSPRGLLTLASMFVLMRAFANGGSSLTGLEAISNGVGVFKEPEGRNARKTLMAMSAILGTLVLGVSWFAYKTHAMPYTSGAPTVISQIAHATLGEGKVAHILFLLVQLATMLILYTGANTPFSGFPFLVSFIAEDGFLPRQLTKRGHRLAFSNGIIVLTACAIALLLVIGAHVDKLVAFYAIGVFTGFTMAGFGMAKRSFVRKERGWRVKMAINVTSGITSMIVVLVFAVVKFTEGAWLVVVIFPLATLALVRLHKQYVRENEILAVSSTAGASANIARHDITVLVDGIDLATARAVRYARSLRPHSLRAVHFVVDEEHAESVSKMWTESKTFNDIPLSLIDCPDRRLSNAVVDYSLRVTANPSVELTLLLPRRSYSPFLGRLLHDNTAESIARGVSQLPRVVATIVPFDVERILAVAGVAESATEALTPVAPVVIKAPILEQKRVAIPRPLGPEGQVAIGDLRWRQRAVVEGKISAIRVAPSVSAPALEVEVWDDSGGLTLHFLGRVQIQGLIVGAALRADGMIGEHNGAFAMYNPKYVLLPGDSST
jgi:amino acid transporter